MNLKRIKKWIDNQRWKFKIWSICLFPRRSRIWIMKNLCSRGWHSMRIHKYSVTEWKETTTNTKGVRKHTTSVEYLKCRFCEFKFFATLKDKEKYENLHPKRSSLAEYPIMSDAESSSGSGGKK